MIPDAVFTLAAAKAHLRVTWPDEDALITALLDAAVSAVERLTRRAWTERTWDVTVDACDLGDCGCDSAVFHALLSPATAKVFSGEPEVEFPAGDVIYSTRHGHTVVSVSNWSAGEVTGNVGRIEFTAKPPRDEVPADIQSAVMLTLGDLYENREAQVVGSIVQQNAGVEMLTRPYVLEMHA